MRIVFRADASAAIGWGHVMRCLALAETLADRGASVTFVSNAPPVPLAQRIGARGFALYACSSAADGRVPAWRDDAAFTCASIAAAGARPDWLVVDHYGLDRSWEESVAPVADGILAIDDLADRPHACSALLDPTPGREPGDYAALVPQTCRLLLGTKWALLRTQFAHRRPAVMLRRTDDEPFRRILVGFGGADPHGLVELALQAIAGSGIEAEVDVLAGSGERAPTDQARRSASDAVRVNTLSAVEDVAEIMARADLAIGASGTSSLERCAMGLPSVMIVAADNQRMVATGVAAFGAADYAGDWKEISVERIADAILRLANDGRLRAHMAERAFRLCDARGVDRAHLALSRAVEARDGGRVSLRLAEAADEDLMYRWQQDPATRRFARDRHAPSREGHHAWTQRVLNDADSFLMVIEHGAEPAGVVRLDPPGEAGERELSILVAPASYGRGIASAALRVVDQLFPGWTLRAEVLPENAASHRLFQRAGYRQIEPARYVRAPLSGGAP